MTAAANTIIGGPNATRRRFTKLPSSMKSRNCTTKNNKAASSASTCTGEDESSGGDFDPARPRPALGSCFAQ